MSTANTQSLGFNGLERGEVKKPKNPTKEHKKPRVVLAFGYTLFKASVSTGIVKTSINILND